MTTNLLADASPDYQKALTNGVHCDIPAADYHAIPAVSSSILKRLYTSSPKHVHAKPVESTEAMDQGTALHSFLLDRDFHGQYFIMPDKLQNWSTVEGKLEKAQHRPRAGTLSSIAEATGRDPDWFLDPEVDPSPFPADES